MRAEGAGALHEEQFGAPRALAEEDEDGGLAAVPARGRQEAAQLLGPDGAGGPVDGGEPGGQAVAADEAAGAEPAGPVPVGLVPWVSSSVRVIGTPVGSQRDGRTGSFPGRGLSPAGGG